MDRLDLTRYDGHTPGPWQWVHGESRLVSGEDAVMYPVADCDEAGIDFGGLLLEERSNRALIEDAPTLLSALKYAYAEIDWMREILTEAVEDADAHAPAWELRGRIEDALHGWQLPGWYDDGDDDEEEVK